MSSLAFQAHIHAHISLPPRQAAIEILCHKHLRSISQCCSLLAPAQHILMRAEHLARRHLFCGAHERNSCVFDKGPQPIYQEGSSLIEDKLQLDPPGLQHGSNSLRSLAAPHLFIMAKCQIQRPLWCKPASQDEYNVTKALLIKHWLQLWRRHVAQQKVLVA